MDLGTHALAGMAVGAAAARKEPLVAALATGVIASVLPDLDAWLYFINLPLYYTYHRLFTHPVVALPVIAGVAAAAGLAIGRTRRARAVTVGVTAPPRGLALLLVAVFALALHLALDYLCDFPLRLLWPFSNYDFALYLISYSHPAFTLGFVVIILALLYPLARQAAPPGSSPPPG
jgi:inner membrane protein